MAVSPEEVKKAWETIQEQVTNGTLAPKNEEGEDIIDLVEDWNEAEHDLGAAPYPSQKATGAFDLLQDLEDPGYDDCDLDSLFGQLEELELQETAGSRPAPAVSKGFKKGFLLSNSNSGTSSAPPKGILKASSSVGAPSQAANTPAPSSSSRTTAALSGGEGSIQLPKEAGARQPSSAFTGRVVERNAPAMSTNSTQSSQGSNQPQQPRVSKFKQRQAGQ